MRYEPSRPTCPWCVEDKKRLRAEARDARRAAKAAEQRLATYQTANSREEGNALRLLRRFIGNLYIDTSSFPKIWSTRGLEAWVARAHQAVMDLRAKVRQSVTAVAHAEQDLAQFKCALGLSSEATPDEVRREISALRRNATIPVLSAEELLEERDSGIVQGLRFAVEVQQPEQWIDGAGRVYDVQ